MADLHGLTALVAGGGVGNAGAVRALMDAGCRVVLQAQGETELASATALAALDDQVSVVDRAVDGFADADAVVAGVVDEYGSLEVLLTPTAPRTDAGLREVTADAWDADLRSSAKRSAGLARAAARQFVEQGGGGRIITFGSAATFTSRGVTRAAVNSSVISLTSALHVSLADKGVTANCVMLDPGLAGDGAASRLLGSLVVHLADKASADIAGRLVYCSEHELGLYTMPLIIESAHVVLRFGDDVDDGVVHEYLQPLLHVGRPA